ncbi:MULTISPECIES: MAB family class A beta-lactamase [Mycobacteroides]|jgi:beta-lactamase class A|uniref:Class A beta-lactamase n=1 Tax=Mycobacteroides chelonae TaxID=1774 RepID=A0AB73MZR1_MYCCH|nr:MULTISPECIES: MAB family class A beta-lactamase [Mycobacteroides]KRQ22808.1 class A beta-lactamase [Mycobacteroides sp. H072]KRQ40399.1 class A beta-lactamase [Mycobacteroides sp. H002]KRQ47658.1 class A beta-lactamase [Mycobacteroides sp. H054]KRQ70918.1 class A beta-lactamase [Mycobacteroides sp. H001]MBF9326674.1 class A beta-lactamase [Mycobacteroides chelonae]
MISRRAALVGGLSAVALAAVGCSRSTESRTSPSELASLEKDFGGRVGVFALDTGSGATLGHRADERFLMCSTVKTFIVSAILHRRLSEPGLLDKRIQYAQSDLMEWAPITSQHVAEGMTVSELCDATLRYSDNTGANLLIAQLGGPKQTEKFVRSLGDNVSRMDRTEDQLNVPDGDLDTSTPQQLVTNLRRLVLDEGLDAQGRDLLTDWLKRNTTGDQSIRAGVPTGWTVGDKTGSGFKGETNDIAVIWPTGRAPIVVAVLTVPDDPKSTQGKPTIAAATRIALKAFGA